MSNVSLKVAYLVFVINITINGKNPVMDVIGSVLLGILCFYPEIKSLLGIRNPEIAKEDLKDYGEKTTTNTGTM